MLSADGAGAAGLASPAAVVAQAAARPGGPASAGTVEISVAFQSALNSELWWSSEITPNGGSIGVCARPMNRRPRPKVPQPGCLRSFGGGRAEEHGFIGRWFCLVRRTIIPPSLTGGPGGGPTRGGPSYVTCDSDWSIVQASARPAPCACAVAFG
jgi:hypothetical protein